MAFSHIPAWHAHSSSIYNELFPYHQLSPLRPYPLLLSFSPFPGKSEIEQDTFYLPLLCLFFTFQVSDQTEPSLRYFPLITLCNVALTFYVTFYDIICFLFFTAFLILWLYLNVCLFVIYFIHSNVGSVRPGILSVMFIAMNTLHKKMLNKYLLNEFTAIFHSGSGILLLMFQTEAHPSTKGHFREHHK